MPQITNKPGGGKPDKLIRDALIAVQRQDPNRLKRVAEAWWLAAETDQAARNGLADRIDGKAVQPIAGDDENPLNIFHHIQRTVVDPKHDNAPDTNS